MKKLILSIAIMLIGTFIMAQSARIIKVNPVTNTVWIKNYSGATLDISTYRFCTLFAYSALNSHTVNSGSLSSLASGDTVEISAVSMNSSGADLGLYLPTGSFGTASSMVDFVQWETTGNGRESVAVAKGIWTAATSVNGNPPYVYTGNGSASDVGVSFWDTTVIANAPVITTQPSNATVTENTNATFSVSASDATGFQWQEDTGSGFTSLADAGIYSGSTTADLTLTAVTTVNNGFSYRCIVTGAITPNDTSSVATLTVNTVSTGGPATILIQNFEYVPSTLSVNAGDSIRFKWVEGSHPTESIDATWSTFTLGSTDSTFDLVINTNGIYKYFCTMHGSSDVNGNVSGMAGQINVGNVSSTDIYEDNLNKTFIVGPNPFEDQISIVHNIDNINKIEVVNVIGSVITSKSINEMQNVSLKNLESGMYFVKAYDNNNDLLRTVKIIKK